VFFNDADCTNGGLPFAILRFQNRDEDGIVPVYPLAHTLGCGEALTGQLYLAVLVARLVSMQLSATGKVADESYTPK
jgi:hypothetical protein